MEEGYLNFDEYIRQGEPSQREKAGYWQTAIGLQAVDGLKVSSYLQNTACRHIEGDITIDEARELVNQYYITKTAHDANDDDKEEADRVSSNIVKVLSSPTFDFSTGGYQSVHRRVFEGVMKHAGEFRKYDITKKEWVLEGDTVLYLNWEDLRRAIDYDLEQERAYSYKGKSQDEIISHLTKFVSGLWQIHAFGEGNTRTTAVFMIKYLKTLGFKVTNELFATHSWYFRNALVRANYSNLQEGITETTIYLERFFRNMLLGETTPLRNRELHLDWNTSTVEQSATPTFTSANFALGLPAKCKNCTLEEIAVLRVIQQNPSAPQKFVASEIGKSERTVKSITARLTELGIIRRSKGKGSPWEIIKD
jgi:fido (protein-threonine AMPylation protein)